VPEASLAARGVSHTYGAGAAAVRALDEVSLDFEPARLHLLMGPSGSGKTTLLTLLGGLLTPDSGEIHLAGREISALPEPERARLRRRSVGFVFQAFRLFRALTALENVMLSLEIDGHRGQAAADRATAVLDSVGLSGKIHRRPDELSGGEKQRVAIARALVHDPAVILADEPTASLDGKTGMQVVDILKRLAEEERRLIVVVSHDPRLVPHAHRTVRMEDGRIVEDEVRS